MLNLETPRPTAEDTGSGKSVPKASYIGKGNCPVACTCFPKPASDSSITSTQTFCAYLDNNQMYECPQDCCTPSCF